MACTKAAPCGRNSPFDDGHVSKSMGGGCLICTVVIVQSQPGGGVASSEHSLTVTLQVGNSDRGII